MYNRTSLGSTSIADVNNWFAAARSYDSGQCQYTSRRDASTLHSDQPRSMAGKQ